MTQRFKSIVSNSTDKIEDKLKIEADQEKKKYKQEVIEKSRERMEILQKKLEESEQQFQNSEKQVEECKTMITKYEEEKKLMLIYGKCQISVTIHCSFANLSVVYLFTSLSNIFELSKLHSQISIISYYHVKIKWLALLSIITCY